MVSESSPPALIAHYKEARRVEEPPDHHDDAIRHFDRYWRALCDDLEHLPSRKDLDPVAMGAVILPWMLLVELREDDEGVYFHYRLCGTEIASLAGQDVTGKTTRDVITGGNLHVITDPYLYSLKQARPSFWETAVFHEIYHWRPVVRGVWPLSDGGDKIDMFVNLTVPVRGNPQAASTSHN